MNEKDIAEQAYNNGYNQAILDFVESLKRNGSVWEAFGKKFLTYTEGTINLLAKGLLRGNNNGKSRDEIDSNFNDKK